MFADSCVVKLNAKIFSRKEEVMTIDERIEKMERQLVQVRWFNRCLIACIVLSLGLWFVCKSFGPENAWAQTGRKVINATGFILEDESGKMRSAFSIINDGPVLRMLKKNGKTSFWMTPEDR